MSEQTSEKRSITTLKFRGLKASELPQVNLPKYVQSAPVKGDKIRLPSGQTFLITDRTWVSGEEPTIEFTLEELPPA